MKTLPNNWLMHVQELLPEMQYLHSILVHFKLHLPSVPYLLRLLRLASIETRVIQILILLDWTTSASFRFNVEEIGIPMRLVFDRTGTGGVCLFVCVVDRYPLPYSFPPSACPPITLG